MQEFPIAPVSMRGVWLIAGLLALVLVPVLALVGAAIMGARTARFEVSREGLRLRGDIYGRLIPAAQLLPNEARRVDFDATPELKPRWRTFGTGMPGYRSGWFRLRNGEKALLYLTDRSRAVYVPTTAGYSVLVSPADPEGFVAAVRGIGRGEAGNRK